MIVDRSEEPPGAGDRGSALAAALAGVVKHSRATALQAIETSTTRNARHGYARDPKGFSTSVPGVVAADREFLARIWRLRRSKNRRLGAQKGSITQVLISRTLDVCGEVAERLKAAVC